MNLPAFVVPEWTTNVYRNERVVRAFVGIIVFLHGVMNLLQSQPLTIVVRTNDLLLLFWRKQCISLLQLFILIAPSACCTFGSWLGPIQHLCSRSHIIDGPNTLVIVNVTEINLVDNLSVLKLIHCYIRSYRWISIIVIVKSASLGLQISKHIWLFFIVGVKIIAINNELTCFYTIVQYFGAIFPAFVVWVVLVHLLVN